MPKARIIKPKTWDDEKLGTVSRDARLLYIGMWNFCDDFGIVAGNLVLLKSSIFPYDEDITSKDIKEWAKELIAIKRIVPFKHNDENYFAVPTLRQHQSIDTRYQTNIVPLDAIYKILKDIWPEEVRDDVEKWLPGAKGKPDQAPPEAAKKPAKKKAPAAPAREKKSTTPPPPEPAPAEGAITMNLNKLRLICINDESWHQSAASTLKMRSAAEFVAGINAFFDEMVGRQEDKADAKEAKNHCYNWIRLRVEKQRTGRPAETPGVASLPPSRRKKNG